MKQPTVGEIQKHLHIDQPDGPAKAIGWLKCETYQVGAYEGKEILVAQRVHEVWKVTYAKNAGKGGAGDEETK
jgi:hypothetical protein